MPNVKVDLFSDYQRLAVEWARSGVYSGNLKIKNIGKQQDFIEPWLRAHSFDASVENMHQRMLPHPRKVYFSNGLEIHDEHTSDVRILIDAVKRGDDLTPFLGNNIRKLGAPDALLNYFGIVHFHLKPLAERIAGQDDNLIFAHVTDDAVYVVGFGNHNDFKNTRFIKALQKDFPETLQQYRFDSEDGIDIDSEECAKMCQDNYNAVVRINGVSYYPPGGGTNLNGNSTIAYCDMIVQHARLDAASEMLRQDFLHDLEKLGRPYAEKAIQTESLSLKLLRILPVGLILECPELEFVVSYRTTNKGLIISGVCGSGRVC